MTNFKWVIPAVILTGGVCLTPSNSAANPDFTKRTGKKCVYCHVGDWTSQKYTEAGKYFKEHNTLKGFVPKEQAPPPKPPSTAPTPPSN